jgi:hypothetical protein
MAFRERKNNFLKSMELGLSHELPFRLMSAKNGQLLKVSSAADNTRLAYACATNQFGGHSRDFIARLYTRRLVQRLNEQLGWSEKGSVSDQLALSPEDTATLVWSLGELGARRG